MCLETTGSSAATDGRDSPTAGSAIIGPASSVCGPLALSRHQTIVVESLLLLLFAVF
jgi:hypothetical protein